MPIQQIFDCPKSQNRVLKNKELQKIAFNGWEGKCGCYCSQCWLRQEKGTYEEWVELHTNAVKLWLNGE